MSVKLDDLTGMLNLISHEKHIQHLDDLVTRYRELVCQLCTVVSPIVFFSQIMLNFKIEMECMSEQEYILEIYDEAFGTGQRVINNEFPLATTSEEFVVSQRKQLNAYINIINFHSISLYLKPKLIAIIN